MVASILAEQRDEGRKLLELVATNRALANENGVSVTALNEIESWCANCQAIPEFVSQSVSLVENTLDTENSQGAG